MHIALIAFSFLVMPALYAADYEIYIDSDLNPATGCTGGVPLTSPIEGAESRIEFSTSDTAPHQVDSLRTSSCVAGSFLPAVDQPAGFPTGSNNGIDGSDVIETETPLQALGLNGNEIINAAIFGSDSGTAGPVTRLSGLSLSTGQPIERLPVPVPVLALTGIVLLLALFLFTGMRFLQGRATLATLLVVLSGLVLSGALLAQAVRFVADGLIDDWVDYPPAASNPPGSGSPLTDIRQVFFATQGTSMFVRLDVTEIEKYTVGGSLTGLVSGDDVVLVLNGSNDQTLTVDGDFVFPPLLDGSSYTVSVSAQPTGQACTVNNGSGTLAGANITNVNVSCVNQTYTLGGTLSGLVTGFGGNTVVLQNNAGDDLTLSADGAFTFSTPVAYGDAYIVAVKTQPASPNEPCTVSNGSGTMPASDINGVSVNCPVEALKLTGANPSFGPTAGGYSIELSGSGFLPIGPSVTVGGADCTVVTVIDSSRLTCTVPAAQAEGPVDIVVTTSAGQSAPLLFNYRNPMLTTLITGTAQAISFHTVQLNGLVATATTATPTYQWTQIFGEPVNLVDANTPNLSFEAPGVSIGQSLEFRLDTSADGISGHATHVVTISPELVGVDAGADVQTITGTPVSFHAVGHSEGGALTWSWTQLEGDVVTINGADSPNATFTAPATDGTLKFEVTVTDPVSVTASDQVEVLVSIPPAPKIYNATRIATSGLDAVSMAVVVDGGLPTGAAIQWNQVSGPAVTLQGAETLNPSFFAPDVQQPTDLGFEVRLLTAQGAGSVTLQTVKVYPRPDTSPLHVDAGRDQTAEAGDTLQLYADVLSGVTAPSYQWKQLAGRPAVLVNADAQNALVQLPAIPDVVDALSNSLLFEVAVTDGVRRGTDTVEVQLYTLRVDASVSDPALLSRGFVLTGDTVHLTSRAQRARAPLTASWTQNSGPAATLTDADRPDASALLPQAGSYTFEVTATDALGNTDTESVSVFAADPPPPPSVVIPSASQLTASVTGGSTRTQNPTYEGDSGVTAEVHFGSQAAPPTITWQQTFGPLVTLMPSAGGKTVSFDAPLVTVDTLLILEATVDDGVGTVTVPVDYLIQDRPIHLSVDRVADSFVGKSTTLHGLADGGGGTLTYQWAQVNNGEPTVSLQDFTTSTAHFTAAQAGAYVFELAVSDNLNNTATAQVTSHVLDVPSPPQPPTSPVEILFPPAGNWVEGNSAQYVGVIQNLPTDAQVAWSEVLGLVAVTIAPDATDPRRVNLTFPTVTVDTAIQLKVTVTDGGGTVLKEATSPRMLVRDHPLAVAAQVTGGSSTIRIGDTVHLGASATGTSGAVNYLWILKSGSGALSQATTATPTFVPATAGTAELEVTATDALANTGKTTVAVTASFKALVFTAPAEETRSWPADAAASPVTLHMTPTGGSGQFRFDYKLQIYSYQSKAWVDTQPGVDFDLDVSTPGNPAVSLLDQFFSGAGNANCDGVPCNTVKGRLQITLTDAGSGETRSGTTEITWGGFSPAQQALVSKPPTASSWPAPLEDRRAAFAAAVAADAPVGQYVCAGVPQICEKLSKPATSTDSRNVYGILKITNHNGGDRELVRRFGDEQTAIQEWVQGTKNGKYKVRCNTFEFGNIYTEDFECTFAYEEAFSNDSPRLGTRPANKDVRALYE